VASIADEGWRALGLEALRAQHSVPPGHRTDSRSASAHGAHHAEAQGAPLPRKDPDDLAADSARRAQQLLARADADADAEDAAPLVADALRLGPCPRALPTLGRVAPEAAVAAADALLLLLGQYQKD